MIKRFIGVLIVLLLSTNAWSAPCASGLLERLVPHADGPAMFPQETIQREYRPPKKMAEREFDHLVGMLNAVTVYPCDSGRPALIEFQSFEIVRLDPATGKLVVETTMKFGQSGGGTMFSGMQFKRKPEWFISGTADRQPAVMSQKSGVFVIDLKSVSENIVHLWSDPRTKAAPGHAYGVRAKVRITGDARLQFGMDYWKGLDSAYNGWSEACAKSNNCEAWLGDWLGDTKGEFITVVSPRSLLGNSH